MNYEFNPENFGFEHISNFPELQQFFGNTTYVKVTSIGGKSFGRVVYWYSFCYNIGMTGDQRWKIGSSVYDISEASEFNSHAEYQGLISTDQFAFELLCNIMGTLKNESVNKEGKERVKQNINGNRLKL